MPPGKGGNYGNGRHVFERRQSNSHVYGLLQADERSGKMRTTHEAVNCDLHPMYIRAMATGDKSQVRPIEESLLADMTDDRK